LVTLKHPGIVVDHQLTTQQHDGLYRHSCRHASIPAGAGCCPSRLGGSLYFSLQMQCHIADGLHPAYNLLPLL
jgi:hypothetical protein